jgi:cbb3-type cytochrome oxidase cytochrome c subunit
MGRKSGMVLKIALIVAGMMGIFFYIALEVEEEKTVIDFSKADTELEVVKDGREIFFGKGRCAGCHSLGRFPTTRRAPELYEAGDRMTKEYIYESMTAPQAYIRLNYDPPQPRKYSMIMPVSNQRPTGLSEKEMLAVIAFLQSLGGKVTVGPEDLKRAKGG